MEQEIAHSRALRVRLPPANDTWRAAPGLCYFSSMLTVPTC
jgi:hypothetical protein